MTSTITRETRKGPHAARRGSHRNDSPAPLEDARVERIVAEDRVADAEQHDQPERDARPGGQRQSKIRSEGDAIARHQPGPHENGSKKKYQDVERDRPASQSFTHVTSDQIAGVHLFDRDRLQLRLGEERRQVEIRLEADVNRQRRDRPLDPRQDGFGLRKWFRKMMRPPGRQTRRISCATLTGSGTTLIRYGA